MKKSVVYMKSTSSAQSVNLHLNYCIRFKCIRKLSTNKIVLFIRFYTEQSKVINQMKNNNYILTWRCYTTRLKMYDVESGFSLLNKSCNNGEISSCLFVESSCVQCYYCLCLGLMTYMTLKLVFSRNFLLLFFFVVFILKA